MCCIDPLKTPLDRRNTCFREIAHHITLPDIDRQHNPPCHLRIWPDSHQKFVDREIRRRECLPESNLQNCPHGGPDRSPFSPGSRARDRRDARRLADEGGGSPARPSMSAWHRIAETSAFFSRQSPPRTNLAEPTRTGPFDGRGSGRDGGFAPKWDRQEFPRSQLKASNRCLE